MHIPDGFLEPRVWVPLAAAGAGAVALAARRAKGRLEERQVPLLGVTAAFLFAAQMINVPVLPGVVSGHFLGGTFVAILLGPSASVLVMATVLVIQCFLLFDGGVTALGANVMNLAVVGGAGGWCVYAALRRWNAPFAAGAGAWAGTVASAVACAAELAASGKVAFVEAAIPHAP